MRKILLFCLLWEWAIAGSHTVFDRAEDEIRVYSCDACPKGNIGCVKNRYNAMCQCPPDMPHWDQGVHAFDTTKGGETKCAPARWALLGPDAEHNIMVIGQKLEHKARQCRVYVDEKNENSIHEKLSCVAGEFLYTKDAAAAYSCPFGDKPGRLFVHAKQTEAASSHTVRTSSASNFTFELSKTTLRDRFKISEGNSAFFATDGVLKIKRINSGSVYQQEQQENNFDVTGFYCIIEERMNNAEIPETYMAEYGLPNDLRTMDRHDAYAVDSCLKCDNKTQVCTSNSTGQFCRCDQYHLHFSPDASPKCSNTHFSAASKDNQTEIIVADMHAQTLFQINGGLECHEYVGNWNKMHRLNRYLHVHARTPNNRKCPDVISLNASIGVKSYYLGYEKTMLWRANDNSTTSGSFYAHDNRIWARPSDCLVIAVYCIVEEDKTPTSYPGIYADLRIPKENRPDYRAVSNCTECFPGQDCSFSAEIDKYVECFCPEDRLSFYPKPRYHDRDSEAACKNTYFLGWNSDKLQQTTVAHMQPSPMIHEKAPCEEFVKDAQQLFSCFAGEFGRHPVHKGTYTCDFGTGSGYLFIHTYQSGNNWVHCAHDRTLDVSKGVKSFILYKEKTANLKKDASPHFIAKNDRIWLGDCLVVGLYCIRRTY